MRVSKEYDRSVGGKQLRVLEESSRECLREFECFRGTLLYS